MRYPGTRFSPSSKFTHSDRLERYLGADVVKRMSDSMSGWYGPPIAVAGVPGEVFAIGGGEFVGRIDGGQEMSWLDRAVASWKKWKRYHAIEGRYSPAQMNAFANLSAVIAAVTGGKAQNIVFQKIGVTADAIGCSMDLWTNTGGTPAAGAAGAAAPGGTATTNASTGHWGYANPANANTGHFLRANTISQNVGTLMLIDQLFRVAKLMNSTATEAVTGTFARYQSGTATAEDYIGGNFCFPSIPTTILPSTAHNWTVCQYTDQASGTGNAFASTVGQATSPNVGEIDIAAGPNSWFMALASGDVGVKALTQMQCSAAVATGTVDFVVAHPIAIMPLYVANLVAIADGLYSAMALTRVYDNACLSALELNKPATTASTYSGTLTLVAE